MEGQLPGVARPRQVTRPNGVTRTAPHPTRCIYSNCATAVYRRRVSFFAALTYSHLNPSVAMILNLINAVTLLCSPLHGCKEGATRAYCRNVKETQR
jgi:hypothetical protein